MNGERKGPSRDRILWLLNTNDARRSGAKLRSRAGKRYVLLDGILADLAKEGRIRIDGDSEMRFLN